MRRTLIFSTCAVLAGCATPSASNDASDECRPDKGQYAIGKAYDDNLGQEVQKATGARALRAIRPGQAVTMDFRPDRLNIEIDEKGNVVRVTCG